MLLKCLVILTTVLAVQSASIYQHEGRNIPVEIRYEKAEKNLDEVPIGDNEKGLELQEDNQLKLEATQPKDVELIKTESEVEHLAAIRNLDEKIQLPQQQISEALKHVPIASELEELEPLNVQEEDNVQLKKLGEVQTTLNNIQNTNNRVELVQQVEKFITNGLNSIRSNFKPQNPNQLVPEPELWEKLEKDLSEYFTEEKNKLGGKQDQGGSQQNFFQNLANGIQTISNNFVQSIQGAAGNGTQGDEQPGGWQGFVGYFQGGVQNLLNTVNNIGGQTTNSNSTVLGDTGSQQPPSNFISNIFNNVQQLFQGGNQGNNQGVAANGTQSDTTPSQQGPGGFFAGAINQFTQTISNVIPGSQTQSQAPVQGDEGTPANGTSPVNQVQQVIQSFGSNIGNAINQFIGGTSNRPQGSEDENNQPPQNQNFIQSIGQNIGNAFQNIQNAFGGSTQNPLGGSGSGGGSNPANAIVGQVQNVGTQLQQLAGQQAGSNPIQNPNPGGSNSAKQPAESTQPPSTLSSEELPAQTQPPQPPSGDVKSLLADQAAAASEIKNPESAFSCESAQPLTPTLTADQPVVSDQSQEPIGQEKQQISESPKLVLPTVVFDQPIANDQSLELNNQEKQQVTDEEIRLVEKTQPVLQTEIAQPEKPKDLEVTPIVLDQRIANDQSLEINNQEKQQATDKEIRLVEKTQPAIQIEIAQPEKPKDLEVAPVISQDYVEPQSDIGLPSAEEIIKFSNNGQSNKEIVLEKQPEESKEEIMMTAE